MAITVPRIFTAAQADSASSVAVSSGTLPSAGSSIVPVTSTYKGSTGGEAVSISDNQGGNNASYVAGKTDFRNNSGATLSVTASIRCRKNISAPSGTYTVTQTGVAGEYWSAGAIEVVGLDNAAAVDATASNGATSSGDPITAPSTGASGTTSVADALLIGVLAPNSDSANTTAATPGGFTTIFNTTDSSSHQTGNGCFKILAATGAQTITWGNIVTAGGSGAWCASEAVFIGVTAATYVPYQPNYQRSPVMAQ